MNDHFWLRKREILGQQRKPACDSRAVLAAAQAERDAKQRRESMRSAMGRLWRAMDSWTPGEDWHSLKARILAKVAA